jgi:hypothetical protein
VREEATFTGNIGPGTHIDEKAVESLRRLGAKVQATNILLRWCLYQRRIRPCQGEGDGLVGLSNSLGKPDSVLYTKLIQVDLKVARDYGDEYLRQILEEKIRLPRS